MCWEGSTEMMVASAGIEGGEYGKVAIVSADIHDDGIFVERKVVGIVPGGEDLLQHAQPVFLQAVAELNAIGPADAPEGSPEASQLARYLF